MNRPKQAALISNLFTQDEFQVLHDIHTIFQVPHAAQELLSAEKTPTLSMALPAFEMLITSWTHLQKTIPKLAHYIGVGIAKINMYMLKGRKSCIYALAMSKSYIILNIYRIPYKYYASYQPNYEA